MIDGESSRQQIGEVYRNHQALDACKIYGVTRCLFHFDIFGDQSLEGVD
jgi:hypothetical protein